jgi:mannose-1-phosphate guanylyltransferase
LPRANVIQQPVNRGTAHGVLLSVLTILERDPLAQIVFLPADHYVRDEHALAGALRETVTATTRDPAGMFLIGIEPEEPDPELGYIVPGDALPNGFRAVRSFVEKPDATRAHELINTGALWNSFIFAATGATLLQMIRSRTDDLVDRMETALARDSHTTDSRALAGLYEQLLPLDFSRHIVAGSETNLRVIRAPACGWSDLGTPTRVAATLRRLPRRNPSEKFNTQAPINLAYRHSLPLP